MGNFRYWDNIVLIYLIIHCYYRKISNIRRTKSQNLNDAHLVLKSSLPNPLKPCVKSRTKMKLEQRLQAMLQLHLSDRQFNCLLRCALDSRLDGIVHLYDAICDTDTTFPFMIRQWQWSWWRHQMETFLALLAICAGNSPVSGEFPAQRPVTRSFDVFFICAWMNGWVNTREAGD